MAHSIDYGNLMHRAMRGLIQSVLADVARNGLPGAHHFFITFDTNHPDVVIADWLHSRYPGEMTVVIQHWFEDLEVSDDGFSITLNFGDQPERMVIPFDSVRTFVDPSVEFGLRFETHDDEEDDEGEDATVGDDADVVSAEFAAGEDDAASQKPAPTKPHAAEVVSLDKFRK
ncbi:MAG: ClpXP protease specificity-enhancing factor SspB [Pseudorhodobacter sp.]|nr:ClpXP protease specificity-enhancing factor SspB [Pseudorhodobacter sp.]